MCFSAIGECVHETKCYLGLCQRVHADSVCRSLHRTPTSLNANVLGESADPLARLNGECAMPKTPSYNISSGWKLLCMDMGLSTSRVLKRAGLAGDLMARLPTRISHHEFNRLWQALADEAAPESVVLECARKLSIEAFSPPLFAMVCCPNIRHAAGRIARYKPLIGPINLGVETTADGGVMLIPRWPAGLEPNIHLGFMELLFWVALPRLTTRRHIIPTQVTAPELPAEPELYRQYIGVSVSKGARWSISFSKKDADRPFLTANESIWEFFEPSLRARLYDLDHTASTAERVSASLREMLPAGEDNIDAVAQRLSMSKRTLQRRLSKEQTSFQDVLQDTRRSLACHYLKESDLPSSEVAFLLGYSDPNSFYRAFKSWTGKTPEAMRTEG